MKSKGENNEESVGSRKFPSLWRRILLICIANLVVGAAVFLLLEACSAAAMNFVFLKLSPFKQQPYVAPDHDIGWVLTPYIKFHSVQPIQKFDIVYRTDRRFRLDGQDIASPGVCDVIIIGDSHVFGYGLAEEETLSRQLHEMFVEVDRPQKVLNAGVPGYCPGQYYLYLRSLGTLAGGALVVVYVNPLNDLVNLSMEIDYGWPKPCAQVRGNRLFFSRPTLYDPGISMRFAPEYDRLNQVFRVPKPKAMPVIARIARWSATARLAQGLRSGTLRFPGTGVESGCEIGKDMPQEEYEQRQQEAFRKSPTHYMRRFWPVVVEFEPERHVLEKTLKAVFAAMKSHVESFDAQLIVVVSQECYRNQPYWLRLTEILEEECPEYNFDWDLPRSIVVRSAEETGLSVLQIRYPRDRLNRMYVPFDGHTSGEGFKEVARQLIDWKEAPARRAEALK